MSARLLAALLALSIFAAQAEEAEKSADEMQPRFIWGVVIRFIASEVFSSFAHWVKSKINWSSIAELRRRTDTTGGAVIIANPSGAAVAPREAPAVSFERPAVPIRVESGAPNYQGVHIAIIGVDGKGELTEARSIREGFQTGERFKLRALSTFGGLLVLDNINPRGERRQIYPAQADAVVLLQPGADTLLPLDRDQYFEFARATGEEQIVISLRDARAVGEAASHERVYRKDEDYGTHFVQTVSRNTYPAISEAIRLQHHY